MGERKRKLVELAGLRQSRWTAAVAQAALAAQEASGDSVAGFARRHGLRAQRLLWWRTRLGDWRGAGGGSAPLLVPAVAPAKQTEPIGGPGPQVKVRLEGVVVEVSEAASVAPAWLAALVRELGGGK